MKFKVGDKVWTIFGDGKIVSFDTVFERYLVKIKDFAGNDGSIPSVYVNTDGEHDKWWFKENYLCPLKGEKYEI